MNPLARVYHLPVRRRTRTPLITVAQFAELMAAISAGNEWAGAGNRGFRGGWRDLPGC